MLWRYWSLPPSHRCIFHVVTPYIHLYLLGIPACWGVPFLPFVSTSISIITSIFLMFYFADLSLTFYCFWCWIFYYNVCYVKWLSCMVMMLSWVMSSPWYSSWITKGSYLPALLQWHNISHQRHHSCYGLVSGNIKVWSLLTLLSNRIRVAIGYKLESTFTLHKNNSTC